MLDRRFDDDLDALLGHLRCQGVANVVVEAAQEVRAAVELRHRGAQAVEDAGELDGDVAAAIDDGSLGQRLQVKAFVGGDRMLHAVHPREDRRRAGGDQDGLGADHLLPDLNAMVVEQPGTGIESLYPGVAQKLAVDPLQAVDLLVLVGDQA